MNIKQIEFQSYRLPFRNPLQTAQGILSDRQGFIIQVIDAQGRVGMGEAAPLAGFGMETLAQTQQTLKDMQKILRGEAIANISDITNLLANYQSTPAAKHGMELALLNLLAQSRQQSLAHLLNPQSRTMVTVNALLGAVSPEIAALRTQEFCQEGFQCIKVKIGTDNSEEDWQRVATVRAVAGSQMQIRIDANQAWSVTEAIAQLQRYATLNIEYVEQPVAAQDLIGMAKVRSSVSIAIAADESVNSINELEQVITTHAADIIILKPMALGGILTAREAAHIATAEGLDVVITTTLDGAIARQGAFHLAASLPHIKRACGLATGNLFTKDVIANPERVRSGILALR